MPKRGENIRKRKDGRWEGRYICERDTNGKAKYCSVYAKSYAEVRQLLHEARSISVQHKKTGVESKTFGNVAEQWLFQCTLRLKHSTIVKYTALLDNHILPYFKDTKLSFISEQMIAEFIMKKSSKLSNSTIHSQLTIIKSILTYARKQGLYNNTIIEIRLSSEPKREVFSLSDIERHKLESFLLTDMNPTKLGLFLCLYTGLRIGELCALRWSDIDLNTMTLHVTSTIQRIKCINSIDTRRTALVISTPKSMTSMRDIPLPFHLVDLLKIFAQQDDCFLLSGNTKPVEPRTMQYRFKKYADLLGLTYSNPHVLRHTFATHCIELGFDVKTLSELLGHSRVEITLNRYVHSSDERKRTQMNLLFESGQKYGLRT